MASGVAVQHTHASGPRGAPRGTRYAALVDALSAALGAGWAQRAWRVEGPATPPAARKPAPDGDPASASTAGGTEAPEAPQTFEAFVAAHERSLFAYLWRSTGDEAAAYDLRQETFIRAWRHFARVRDYERPLAWLYRVAANLVLNYRRDLRPAAPLPGEDDGPATSDPAWRLAERDLVRATLLTLPLRERTALALRAGQGLSCEEVADALGMTPAAARTLLWRARERFRAAYAQASADQPPPPDSAGPAGQGGAR